LKQAALSNQAKLAEEKLIAYASLLWRDTPILHVTAIINLVEDEVLQKELEYFSEVLYGKTPSPFRGRALWQAIEKYTPKKPKKPHPLPPIYPQ
jgi:hypothetical protein